MPQLSEEELSQTLRRASQIARHENSISPQNAQEEYEAYLSAAEEAGISRQAMWQALRERFLVPLEDIKVGDAVFAPSADQAWYAASIVSIEGASSLIVEFLKGGRQSVAPTDIRAMALIPGRQVQFEYDVVMPGMTGIWHNGKVIEYDPESRQAKITEGFASYSVPLTKLRLKAEKRKLPLPVRQLLLRAALISGGIGIGVGFLLGHFLR